MIFMKIEGAFYPEAGVRADAAHAGQGPDPRGDGRAAALPRVPPEGRGEPRWMRTEFPPRLA